jgi:hypothetical protein
VPKTYNTFTNVSTGDVLTATNFNNVLTNIGNYRVPPMVRLTGSANLTSYTSGNVITYNTETYDTDDMHSTSTNTSRITFQTAGVYLVVFSVRATWAGTLTSQSAEIWVNGTITSGNEVYGISTTIGGSYLSVSAIVNAAGGGTEYCDSVYRFGGATGVSIVMSASSATHFSATWLGQVS